MRIFANHGLLQVHGTSLAHKSFLFTRVEKAAQCLQCAACAELPPSPPSIGMNGEVACILEANTRLHTRPWTFCTLPRILDQHKFPSFSSYVLKGFILVR
uniref:Uncharacterized protein n=1 Tax=Sphaerodactylus townsendi TaxID=933632 RepID=A0ACB8FJG2_9SAUR